MAGKPCDIIIPGNVKHRLDWLRDTVQGQIILQGLHPRQRQHRLRCACQPPGQSPAEMVIRQRDNSYHIARMPDSGHRHVRGECDFFSEKTHTADSGSGEYEAAILHHDELTEIKINFALRKAALPDHDPLQTVRVTREGGTRRAAVGLGGLLSHLWNEAAINTWNGNQGRPWETLVNDVHAVADGTTLGQRALRDHLFVQAAEYQPWLPPTPANPAASQQRFLLLFKLHTARITDLGGAWLKTSRGDALLIKKDELDALLRSQRAARAEFARRAAKTYQAINHGPQLLCLALAEWQTIAKQPCLVVQQATLMLANWRFIPVESSYELQVADLLVAQRRTFTKPLRYDAGAHEVFPDFILGDVGGDGVPMEVYGVSGNRRYEHRKRVKREYYVSTGLPYWEWTPKQLKTVPPFPAQRR